MSKKIKIPTRAASKEATDWVETRDKPAASSSAGKPKRLTIDLDTELHRRLKIDCVQKDIQIADRIRGLIQKDLET